MGDVHRAIEGAIKEFIEEQHMFFVGTAPLNHDGYVNVSPKGGDSFRVLSPDVVAYLDYVGSGVETIAHLRENGRIVIMFCAFVGAPQIIRLHGQGQVIEPQDEQFPVLLRLFTPAPGVRSIIRVEVKRISNSCGFAVPQYSYEGQRTQLAAWAKRKGDEGLKEYCAQHNSTSIDGLPALCPTNREGGSDHQINSASDA